MCSLQVPIQLHQEVDRRAGGARSIDARALPKQRRQRVGLEKRLELASLPRS